MLGGRGERTRNGEQDVFRPSPSGETEEAACGFRAQETARRQKTALPAFPGSRGSWLTELYPKIRRIFNWILPAMMRKFRASGASGFEEAARVTAVRR